MVRIYTRTGDKGETSLLSGKRVKKSDNRVSAYGEVDELNSCLGLVIAVTDIPEIKVVLTRIQNELFILGAELATEDVKNSERLTSRISEEHVRRIESEIDSYGQSLPQLKEFILPGGCLPSSALHIARAVCRRAERSIVVLADDGLVSSQVIAYVNRLSDLLFVLARFVNCKMGWEESTWKK